MPECVIRLQFAIKYETMKRKTFEIFERIFGI